LGALFVEIYIYGEKELITPNFPLERYNLVLFCYNVDKIQRIGVKSDKQLVNAQL